MREAGVNYALHSTNSVKQNLD